MEVFLAFLALGSLSVICFHAFYLRSYSPYEEERVEITTPIFCLWMIAAAFWGPYFYVLHLAAFFDISIDRFLLLILLGFMAVGLFTGKVNFNLSMTVEALMLCFVGLCVLSMLQHGFKSAAPQFPAPWYAFITGYFIPFLIFVFAKHYLVSPKAMEMVLWTFFCIGIYLSLISFLEFFGLRQFVYPQFINDPKVVLHLDRARGPFLNSAFNGVALILGYLSSIYLISGRRGLGKVFHFAMMGLFFPAVFFTQTRSVYLAFLFANVALLVVFQTTFAKWRTFSLPIVLVLLVALSMSPKLMSSDRREGGIMQMDEVELRLGLINRSFAMILDNVFLGVGLAQFIPAAMKEYRGRVQVAEGSSQQTQHNHFLGIFVELGIMGIGIYLLIIFTIFQRLYTLTGAIPPNSWIDANTVLLLAIALMIYLWNNLFVEPSYCLFVNVTFFLFGGLVDGLYNRFVLEGPDEGKVPEHLPNEV